jgi:signal transduction histidine kinase
LSLKVKIPLLVAGMLLLNIVILLLFNRLYFINIIAERIAFWSGKPVDIELLQKNKLIWELVTFEMLVIGVLVLIIGVAIYFMCVRPLVSLINRVETKKLGELTSSLRRDEIGRLQNTIYRLMLSLSEEKQIQDRMIASISHDIKTPLTSVLGYSENLLKKQLPPERREQYLSIIHARARDIEYITNEFDSYVAGKRQESVLLKPVKAAFIADMLTEEYGSSDFVFTVTNLCSPSYEAELDLPQMRRVFANLIQNAVKHNRDKTDLQISITLSEYENRLSIELSDNGKGVKPELLPHIFEPFFTTENREGISGLGLSICRNIVEKHGGTISAENANEGLRLRLVI